MDSLPDRHVKCCQVDALAQQARQRLLACNLQKACGEIIRPTWKLQTGGGAFLQETRDDCAYSGHAALWVDDILACDDCSHELSSRNVSVRPKPRRSAPLSMPSGASSSRERMRTKQMAVNWLYHWRTQRLMQAKLGASGGLVSKLILASSNIARHRS